MDRLTKRLHDGGCGWSGDIDHCENLTEICKEYGYECCCCPVGRVLDKLCDYEDTGFTPEAITELARAALNSRNRRK